MEYHACDICNEIIKDELYIVSVVHIDKEDVLNKAKAEPKTISETIKLLNDAYLQRREKTDVKEVCVGCYKILEHLFKIRLRELKKIKKELEETYKLPAKEPKKRKSRKKKE